MTPYTRTCIAGRPRGKACFRTRGSTSIHSGMAISVPEVASSVYAAPVMSAKPKLACIPATEFAEAVQPRYSIPNPNSGSRGPALALFSGICSHTRACNIKDLRQIRLHQWRGNAGVQLSRHANEAAHPGLHDTSAKPSSTLSAPSSNA